MIPSLPTHRVLAAAVALTRPLLPVDAPHGFDAPLQLLRQTQRKARIALTCTIVSGLAFVALGLQRDLPYALICAIGFGVWMNQLQTYRAAATATRIQLERKMHYIARSLEPASRLAVLRALYPSTPAAGLPLDPPTRPDSYLHRLSNLSE